MNFYVIGSLRNPMVPTVAKELRALGHSAFDDWYAGGPEADDCWQQHFEQMGATYAQALYGPYARNIYEFDKRHLDAADAGLLILPAGKSAHLELGYLTGQGKPTYVLFDKVPERWDVMYQFATQVFFSIDGIRLFLQQRRSV